MSPTSKIKKIALVTGGGDCPGLNSAIRSVVQTAVLEYGIQVMGIPNGFKGILDNQFVPLDLSNTTGIFSKGGTILGSSNVDTPFRVPVVKDGKKVYEDHSDRCMDNFKNAGIDALIVIGGDGTQTMAHGFAKKGLKVVGIPKTIDNDLNGTELTIGFFTAVSTAVEALDKLHTTAESHHRVMVVEVMGRNAGWIALFAGLGGDADVILIPEIPFELSKVAAFLKDTHHTRKKYSIVVVAEGAKPVGGGVTVQRLVEDSPEPVRLGGIGHQVANELEKLTGRECRAIVLGHLLRGGSPVGFDRILASRFGVAAVKALVDGHYDSMVAYRNDTVELVPLETGAGKNRFIIPNSPFLSGARQRGIHFGDS
ncbi:MAG: ATP-dependent 6-phosphofructokinase [Proteobacteria bacterium]|nr:ATP-dependent 6-phosphofructokinase [Pseudomonadota bacterium]NDC24332.1 ATP-dependent 6-phosphofructokinase [Pseudomonadota bacterium]NDD04355.1 ATP-dependent 6-phosphofructokinase [Pseudomonadota bacterium]NDG26750.1 ATP-dependent 6-phosphofructokinase [Pseudomonadota bacterium]